MEEPIIGNGGQTVPCFLIVRALRLLREIAAGHDKRPVHVPQQQMVQGCIGQHDSERRMSRRHRLGHATGAGGRQNHYRGRRALEQRLLLTVNGTIPADTVEVSCHQGEGFCVAPFAASKPGNRILVAGVAGEMKAPQPLDRDDCSAEQQSPRRFGRITFGEKLWLASAIDEALKPCVGSARGTGCRLRMEAAIFRIFILGPARRTKGKLHHAGFAPVVRHRPHDREPRPAMRAIRKRVTVTAIGKIERFGKARRAGRGIRTNGRVHLAGAA